MKAHIGIIPKALALRKDGLPRKKPFRIEGNLTIEELSVEKNDKKDRRKVEEVKTTIGDLRSGYVELAELLKELAQASQVLPTLQVDETIEV